MTGLTNHSELGLFEVKLPENVQTAVAAAVPLDG
jgi:hypothetical protein